ncbi:hypothetical protein HG530_013586 [Fusarium avenaceum]|nr:hypothetical protein HG530_013586 [Fusarium avenaceum]
MPAPKAASVVVFSNTSSNPLDLVDELVVESAVGAVFIDAVEKDLASSHRFNGLCKLDNIHITSLATTFNSAGIPTVLFALGAGELCLDDVVTGGIRLGDIDTLGVNAHDYGLVTIGARNLLNSGVAKELATQRVVLLGSKDGIRADRDLISTRLEVHGSDFKSRHLCAVDVHGITDTATDSQGHED